MVTDSPITIDAGWFVGEDKTFTFTIYVPGTTQAQIDAGTAVAQNMTGWTLVWNVRLTRYAGGNPLLSKVPQLLPQSGATLGQCTVAVARSDTVAMKAGTYSHALARTNAGNYDVVSQGDAVLRKAAA
jgi:hypothetical protein